MAGRIRTIKPEFFDSPHTAQASPLAPVGGGPGD